MRMGQALLVFVLLSWAILNGCTKSRFETGEIRVALNFIAKETCSCLFVAERPEEECKKYVEIKQLEPKVTVDRAAKTVESRALFFFKSVARFSQESGCSVP